MIDLFRGSGTERRLTIVRQVSGLLQYMFGHLSTSSVEQLKLLGRLQSRIDATEAPDLFAIDVSALTLEWTEGLPRHKVCAQ